MTCRGKWRGHDIHYDVQKGLWLYADGQAVQNDPARSCGHCGLSSTPEGYDGCLGELPGVMNACCGHGSYGEAYVQFDDGTILRGAVATGTHVPKRTTAGLEGPLQWSG